MKAPLIELRSLTKTYGVDDAAFQALKGIDLTIHKGEFVAIMGPSGSGKSTLMNVLGCLDTPTTGSYQYEGIEVETLDADQRSLEAGLCVGAVGGCDHLQQTHRRVTPSGIGIGAVDSVRPPAGLLLDLG